MEAKVVSKKKAEALPKTVQSDREKKKEAIERNIGAAMRALDKFHPTPSQ